MVYADLDADGKNELVLIDLHHVYIYELSKEGLRRLAHYEVSASDHLVHASVFDLEGDGKNEILVSSLRNAEASSFGFRYDHGELKPVLKDSPWLLQTISSGGKTILIGEPYLGREISSHHIKKLKWTGSALKEEEKFVAPSEVGVYGLSRFDSGLVFLSQSGSLKFYESDGKEGYRKSWSSSESYGGTSNFVNFEVRGILNEVESRRTYINLDPVTGVDEQGRGTVVVAKNDSFLKNVIGTLPMVKNAWLVKLKMEEVGLREVVNTRKIDGYLADVQRVDLPWEKGSKILTLIWLRDKGFASSVGTFQSVVAVYDL